MFKSVVRLSGQIPEFNFQNTSKEIFNKGIQEASNWQSSQFYTQTILPLKIATDSYVEEFNIAVKNYMIENNMLKKMKDSLNPTITRKAEIGIQRGEYQNNKRSTQQLMSTMLKGHSLLLQIRETLTGQHISTKFIIQTEDGVYQIDEKKIQSNLILSKFGGGTMSNPFSLAYQIDQDMLKSYNILKEENEISKTDIWQTIISLKPQYLEWKKQYWASQGIEREYPNIFFDSKDAEIYELYFQQSGTPELNLAQYIDLRRSMGGGGGYATPFFKMGDVGSVQVKFFNFKKNNKNATVNFARFSLLRDRFRQLSKIFSEANPQRMKNELINFFTEKDSNISNIQKVSQEFNEAAKKTIEKLFKNF